jgi:hypothetical protein
LSLRGCSSREVGRRLNISHKTASLYIKAETERRRAERPDPYQQSIDGHREALSRAWEELDKSPSPHAAAQLLHAVNAALNSIDLLNGTRAPTRSKREINIDVSLDQGFERLSGAELGALELLAAKMAGRIDENTDVLREILQRHETGTLTEVEHYPVLELEPTEEDW